MSIIHRSSSFFTNNYWNDRNKPDDDKNGLVDNPYCIDGYAQNENRDPRASYSPDVNKTSTFPMFISRLTIFSLVISIITYLTMRRKFKIS